MKKRIGSFSGGFLTALALTACLTTALAASGKVSYNFANVSLDGTQKITAGQDITAANGQKVPGSILYTDEAGGKTNYLPIRTISELLGTEIGYDSATKTVLLGKQPTEDEYDLRLHRLHAAGLLPVRLSSPAGPGDFRLGPFGRIPPDLLGNLLPVLRGGQAGRTFFRGNGGARLPGRLRHMGPLPNGFPFVQRREAGGSPFQGLVLYLPDAYFLFAGLRPVGPPGR